MEWFRNRIEAKIVIEDWRTHYNEVRPHSSSQYLHPQNFVEFANVVQPLGP
ncbi:integrase core domain-containing protein [Pandoraea horticolens]|uniref:integrase core domain-containing protein n=1 Tax=Pandoraea horticolens TaxID=2508298 RepID=UPI00123F1E85